MKPDEVIKRAVDAVKYAKTFCEDVEFSCEDAGRTEINFMKEIVDAVVTAGATTVNLPDTVGYRLPSELATMVGEIVKFIGERAIISVHNHNDLGLATANSLAAVMAGARQVECTINGLGERAGNSALEEFVMAIKTRQDIFAPLYTNVICKEIYPSSRMVANITGIEPQPNKAIVGKNAFAHESGIHQDGMLKHKETYEIISAQSIGLEKNSLILGKHSGRHAFKDRLISLGFELEEMALNKAFEEFKILCDKKKEVFDDDIRALVTSEFIKIKETYEIVTLTHGGCNKGLTSASITIIDRISGINGILKDYKVNAVSQGKDALANVVVTVEFDNKSVIGHGLDIDTMMASAKAYIGALNSFLHMK